MAKLTEDCEEQTKILTCHEAAKGTCTGTGRENPHLNINHVIFFSCFFAFIIIIIIF